MSVDEDGDMEGPTPSEERAAREAMKAMKNAREIEAQAEARSRYRHDRPLIGAAQNLTERIEKGVMSGLKIADEHFSAKEPVAVDAGELKQFRAWKELQKTNEKLKALPEERRRLDAEAERLGIPVAGTKLDSGKRRWDLLPTGVVAKIVDVLDYGAKKYSPDNWKKVPDARARYYSAAMRHIEAWWNGEEIDPESGLHHLACASCSLMFLIWFDEHKNG